MARATHFCVLVFSLVIGPLLVGCGQAPNKPNAPAPGAGADAKSAAETIADNMAKLSPEDRKAAELQKICPVSDEPLGGMGTPYKLTIDGKDIYLCCAGCEEDVKKEPEKYFAKINK